MSHSNYISSDKIDEYLNDLAENYKKISEKKEKVEIILVGGAAVLLNYKFRKTTNDIDYSNKINIEIEKAAKLTALKYKLSEKWLNNDFTYMIKDYKKLIEFTIPYKTMADILDIKTVSPECLIALKLKALRENKHDTSDIAGILMECKEKGKPLDLNKIFETVNKIYGKEDGISEYAENMINNLFNNNDFKNDYNYLRKRENLFREIYKEFRKGNILMAESIGHKEALEKSEKAIKEKLEDYKKSK